jgi:uncharacterized protein
MSNKVTYLHIAKGIELPIDAVTQKFAFIGRSGSGKTYGAGKLGEQFLEHNVQLIVLDPVGVWNGLRTSADGKGKGFPIPVFGGEHGDIPLVPSSGALIAGLIVEKGISAVLDVSYMRKNERKLFVTDLAEQLFYLKKKNRSAMHLIIEEAQVFVPQRIIKGEERMLGAMEDIIKLGRNYGIGISLISQRPQSVHKDCLNQTEALFAFQINGPHERKAIEDWIIDKGLSKSTVATDLSGLETGSCFLWSPQWLRILKKIHILEKKTFDASQTPKVGKITSKFQRTLAPVDLEKINKEMESVLQEKKENDPAELKKQVTQLKRELQNKNTPLPYPGYQEEIKSLKEQIRNQEKLIANYEQLVKSTKEAFEKAYSKLNLNLTANIQQDSLLVDETVNIQKQNYQKDKPVTFDFNKSLTRYKENEFGKCERAILTVLAKRNGKLSSKSQIAILSGYSIKSSSFTNALSKLRTQDFIRGTGNNIIITQRGIESIGEIDPLPTGSELHNYWCSNLPKAESLILKCIISNYPQFLSKDRISELTGYSTSSSSFMNALSKLRTLELIEGRGEMKASDSLFE